MLTYYKTILFSALALYMLCGNIVAQSIVNRGIYTVNFSNVLHEPLWVSYKLFRGGGDCSRAGFRFYNDIDTLQTSTDKDYARSGYDKGHLANAEDFAYDCTKDELTFRYYNCLPQTPNLNRGVWKVNEEQVRAWSQSDSLLVVCGGSFGKKKSDSLLYPIIAGKWCSRSVAKSCCFAVGFRIAIQPQKLISVIPNFRNAQGCLFH